MTTIQGPVPDPNRLGKTNKAQGDSDDSLKAKKTGGEAVVVDPEKVKRVAKKSAKDVPHIPRKAAAVDPRTGGWLDKKKVSTLVGSVKRSQAQVAELPKAKTHKLTSETKLKEMEEEEQKFNKALENIATEIQIIAENDDLELIQGEDGSFSVSEHPDKEVDVPKGAEALKRVLSHVRAAHALGKGSVDRLVQDQEGRTEGIRYQLSDTLEQLSDSGWAQAIFQNNPELKNECESLLKDLQNLNKQQAKRAAEFTIILDTAKQKQALKKMRASFDTQPIGAGTLEFQKLEASQNPVTHLLSTVHIPKAQVDGLAKQISAIPPSLQPIFNVINKYILPGSFGRMANRVAREIMGSIYSNKTETIEERHAAAMARAKKEATGCEPDDPRRGMWNKIASDLEQVDIGALKSEMRVDQVPVQFKKDAVTSSLRVLLNRAIDQDAPASKIDQISNAIREVKAKPRDYISKSDVIAILDPFTDERDKSFVLRNEEFVSSTDVRMFNPGNVAVEKGLTKLEDRSHMDHPGFAFKLGAENHREMLAGKLLQHMGMNQFVMPKLDVKFEKAKLGSEMSPEGIAGKWLEDAQDLDVKAWDKVGMAKRKLEEAKFKGEDTGQYERELSKAMEPFRELGGAESVQSHALIDLIFCSYDSHQLQYKHKNGQWHCFDFARFLAPFETFSSEGYTWATIRSAFLNDPRCDEAMEETLVDTIKGWDLEAMESDMRSSGLIGTEEEFAQAEKELSAILKDSVSLSGLSDDEAKAMCRKYGMAVGTDDTISDLKAKLASRLSERKAEIKKQTYPKVHPHAFDQMKARMNRLQRYVAESDSPTVTGAYERMYPQLSLFVKVLGRMEANPSLSISFKRDPSGNLMQRNLEMILSEAEDKKMATADEIAQMKEGLAELTANSPESLALATTMDLS